MATSQQSDRHILITSADGATGHTISDLLIHDEDFHTRYTSIFLQIYPGNKNKIGDLSDVGGIVLEFDVLECEVQDLVDMLSENNIDTVCLIPPTVRDKKEVCRRLVDGIKRAGVKNVCVVGSAAADLAERERQPRLREFTDIEALVMREMEEVGTYPVIVRPAFYAENLLLCHASVQNSGKLPLPIGHHSFAPVALGDVALLVANILISHGTQGFDDNIRGQLITLTGPNVVTGSELAAIASETLGVKLEYQSISLDEARRILDAEGKDLDVSEKEYLIDFYKLVNEGKGAYRATIGFRDITGQEVEDLRAFFEGYGGEFKPKRRRVGRRGGRRGRRKVTEEQEVEEHEGRVKGGGRSRGKGRKKEEHEMEE